MQKTRSSCSCTLSLCSHIFVACFDFHSIIYKLVNPTVQMLLLYALKNPPCSPCSSEMSSGCFSLQCPSPCAQTAARPLLPSPPAAVEAEIRSKRMQFLPHLYRSSPRCPRGLSSSPDLIPLIGSFITNGVKSASDTLPSPLPSLRSHRSARCIGICSTTHGCDTGRSHTHTHTQTLT